VAPRPKWKQRLRVTAALALLVWLSACSLSPDRASAPPGQIELDRQVMVMLAQPAIQPLGPWNDFASEYGSGRTRARALRVAESLAHAYRLRILDDWPMPALGVHCVLAGMAPGQDAQEVLAALNADERVAWAQPLHRFRSLASAGFAAAQSPWELPALHEVATGRGVVIAQVDTGVDLKHPNLSGQWLGPKNFVERGGFDPELHGTAVAGLIVARGSPKLDGIGVAPGARLMPLRACWQVDAGAAECTSFTLAKALQHALRQRPHIINLSLSGPPDLLLARLIDRALEQGIVVVAAADETALGPGFPAQHPGVIPAAGGPVPGLVRPIQAPSQDLLTTIPDAAFGFMSGSSFAAAEVAGLTALLLERSPGLAPVQVRAVLDAASGMPATGAALVDPCAALLAVSSERNAPRCGHQHAVGQQAVLH
jgi:hypothetical protein